MPWLAHVESKNWNRPEAVDAGLRRLTLSPGDSQLATAYMSERETPNTDAARSMAYRASRLYLFERTRSSRLAFLTISPWRESAWCSLRYLKYHCDAVLPLCVEGRLMLSSDTRADANEMKMAAVASTAMSRAALMALSLHWLPARWWPRPGRPLRPTPAAA